MKRRGPQNPERSFGVSVGIVLLLIAGYLWWSDRTLAAQIVGGIGLVLTTLGRFRPSLLKWPSALWWKFALLLGHVNARVILTLIFVVVLTPIAVVWRVIGRDPLAMRRRTWTGWTQYPARYRDRAHFERMY